MELQHIREFVVLANQRNYLAAAEELYISQSTLSKHIMALEKEFGFPLFSRTTRKVHLSVYGKTFLPYAQKIIEVDKDFRTKADEMRISLKDSIQFGVLPAFIAYHTEDAIMDFKKKFPQYPVTLVEGSNASLLQSLKDGNCTVAMIRTYENPLPSNLVCIPLLHDRIALITPVGSVFDDGRPSVSWKELEQAELLTSTSQQQASVVFSFAEAHNIHLNIISRMSRTPSIIEMLRKGIGNVALLNKTVSQRFQDESVFRILDIEPPICNTVNLVYRKDQPMTNALRCFIDTVVDRIKEGEKDYV